MRSNGYEPGLAVVQITVKNIFADLPGAGTGEQFRTLFESSALKIERIFSQSHGSPEGFWYDQAQDEWVIVMKGEATLEFAGGAALELKEGDYAMIPRHVKHRVSRTAAATLWLAVHFQ